ncbi:hypothetical protein [Paenibacillus sp. GP183]|uniref:hypothetical protein n=1 Tax=Paenibacillus sp. GP183 TaxID=1882751 RepID=UPI000896B382|nr:hypothetical protein [Paenibacillus sp. GP183]SEC79447.1 hypothetical protein SAMN05443246_5402 [Paenibacillus sp. GP183]
MTLHLQAQVEIDSFTSNQDKSLINGNLGRHEVKVPGSFALKVVKFTEMIYQAAGYKPY